MSDRYKTAVSPNLDRIAEMISKGWSYEKIAKAIGLAPSTFKDYIKKYPELSAIIKKNAHARDVIIEDALFRRAKGEYATVKKPVKVRRIEYENGKTPLIAAICLAEWFCGPMGLKILCASNSYDQAALMHDAINNMREQSPTLERVTRKNVRGIYFGNPRQSSKRGKLKTLASALLTRFSR